MVTENAPDSFYRTKLGLGVWEHRGKVAATGVGHSPTARRWDGKPETSVGAFAIVNGNSLTLKVAVYSMDGKKSIILEKTGIYNFLIGESLLKSDDIGLKLKQLSQITL